MNKKIILIIIGVIFIVVGVVAGVWWQLDKLKLSFWEKHIDNTPPKSYVYFVMNINDYYHSDHSAYYVSKAIDLFNYYNIGLDLYFTEPVLKAYEKNHPETIEKIKNSPLMTINYHFRRPHPCDSYIKRLPDENGVCKDFDDFDYEYIVDKISDFESYELVVDDYNFKMKDYCPYYNKNKIGGFDYVKSVFSTAPLFSGSQVLKNIHMGVLKNKGLKGYVAYHSGQTEKDSPFKESLGLLERPSDFSIVFERVIESGSIYDHFISEIQQFSDYDRPLFVNVLIHDYEFYRMGAYYTKGPKLPNGTISEQWEKTKDEQEYYWQTYEDLVKSFVNNNEVKIITAKNIMDMNEKYKIVINIK